MKRYVLFALLTVALACGGIGCATSGLALKQKIGIALQANETAMAGARVTELAFYNGHSVAAYTVERHLAFIDALMKAQEGEIMAIHAYQVWDPSAPMPAAVFNYRASAEQVLGILRVFNSSPAAQEALNAAQRIVDEAQKLVDLFTKKQAAALSVGQSRGL